MTDIHVWGDSHWRNFFPAVNHGPPGFAHYEDGLRFIDECANELSGATMYGLLRDDSKNGARRRVLGDLDRIGPVKNVGLVFGEVDCRYHNHHYFREDGSVKGHKVLELVNRYKQFIEEDLLSTGRVTERVFVYWGFAHPLGEDTLLQPGQPMGRAAWMRCNNLFHSIGSILDVLMMHNRGRVIVIDPFDGFVSPTVVSADGVHLLPEKVFPAVLRDISAAIKGHAQWEPSI